MLFVLDVGNTNTVLGVFNQGTLEYEWRIKTDRYKTEDEFAVLIESLFKMKDLTFKDIEDIIISSVVPPIMYALDEMCEKYFGKTPIIIDKDIAREFLDIHYPRQQQLGAERVVNAIGAIHSYAGPLIIIDFGTATTYCYIDETNAYYGGLIAPGINIAVEALYQKAAKLPKIELESPEHVIGQSTVEAMQAGVFYGAVGEVDGIVKRIMKEKNTTPTVVATGGLAPLIADTSETIQLVDPYLTLKGLHLIYTRLVDQP